MRHGAELVRYRLVGLLVVTGPGLAAQQDPGAALWRVAGQTLARPPALANGGGAVFWNPAQPPGPRFALGFEGLQGAPEIGVTGVFGAARVKVGRVGSFALMYARMEMSDLVRTTTSPDPAPGTIAHYTHLVGANWARTFGTLTLGVTAARHQSRLDTRASARWTFDLGAAVPLGSRIHLGAATHFLERLRAGHPAQDIYGGVQVTLWRGRPWTDAPPSAVAARYGTAFAHGFGVDHYIGAGLAVGTLATVDVLAVYEGGYAAGGWQPVAGLAFAAGKYRVAVAANPGAAGLGPAFRVGLEALFP
jgi:hypothetical protein